MGRLSIINIPLLAFLFLSSCGLNNTSDNQSIKNNNTGITKPNGTSTKNIVSDTTPPPDLLAAIPANYEKAGWLKSTETLAAAIPVMTPDPPDVMSSAKKTINSVERAISVVFGDITKEKVSAIVNAAKGSLQGGGGVDGAIHKAAGINGDGGKDLKAESAAYKVLHNITSFPIGKAMLTKSYGLAPKISYIIHTVGPQGASTPQKDLELYSAVYNSLRKADECKLTSISIPAISTGIFGFPIDKATELFFKATLRFFADNPATSIVNVRFTNFDQKTVKKVAERFSSVF